MSIPPPDPLEERLLDLLKLVNEWLRYAETKNVQIVGLASGAISLVLIALGFLREEGLTTFSGIALTAGAVLLALSLLVGVYSFLPATAQPRWMRRQVGAPHPDDNLYFFGDLGKYPPPELAEAIARRYGRVESPAVHAAHADVAAQLVVNARITMQKLKLFRWAVVLFAAGVLLAGLGTLVVVLS